MLDKWNTLLVHLPPLTIEHLVEVLGDEFDEPGEVSMDTLINDLRAQYETLTGDDVK